jgi:hypothetical protein
MADTNKQNTLFQCKDLMQIYKNFRNIFPDVHMTLGMMILNKIQPKISSLTVINPCYICNK